MGEAGGKKQGAGAVEYHDSAVERGRELFLGVKADGDFGLEFEIFGFECATRSA